MKILLKKGEKKVLTFTFNVDVTAATFTLICKDCKGATKFTKEDGDFDKADVANKIIKVGLDTSSLVIGHYYIQLKTVWSATSANLSEQTELIIAESLYD